MSYSNDSAGIAKAVGEVADALNNVAFVILNVPICWHAASHMTYEQLSERVEALRAEAKRRLR